MFSYHGNSRYSYFADASQKALQAEEKAKVAFHKTKKTMEDWQRHPSGDAPAGASLAASKKASDEPKRHEPGSVVFEFPEAQQTFLGDKPEIRRKERAREFRDGPLRLIEAFKAEHGHCAISDLSVLCTQGKPLDEDFLKFATMLRKRHYQNSLNPHIREALNEVDFVFGIYEWVQEKAVTLAEEYHSNVGNINLMPAGYTVNGYSLGQTIKRWKEGRPKHLDRPDLKRRLDAIGYDPEISVSGAKFLEKCSRLKAFRLKHGRNPRHYEDVEVYDFVRGVANGIGSKLMKNYPRIREAFDDAANTGKSSAS